MLKNIYVVNNLFLYVKTLILNVFTFYFNDIQVFSLFSHKQFRAMLKKLRRKKIRQKRAKERDQLELFGNILI